MGAARRAWDSRSLRTGLCSRVSRTPMTPLRLFCPPALVLFGLLAACDARRDVPVRGGVDAAIRDAIDLRGLPDTGGQADRVDADIDVARATDAPSPPDAARD